MKTIIIGDVHGCADELKLLVEKCDYEAGKDRVILVGDLINKGPKSLEVISYVREHGFEVVIGNHELKLLELIEDPGAFDPGHPKSSLGRLAQQVSDSDAEWIRSWPLFIEEDDFVVVHAGVAPGMTLEGTPASILASIRTWDGKGENLNGADDPAWYDLYEGDKLIVYGHWAMDGLRIRDNTIGLDSGCCYGKQLSAVILPEKRIVQIDALHTYVPL